MAMTAAQKTDAYRFFAIAFNAAPGATYMSQLFDAYTAGMTTKQIVNVYTTKPEFTATYPVFLSDTDFATKLVNNIVKAAATTAAKAEAVADIVASLALGQSRGDVIYTIFNNLATKDLTDATWGNTAKQMANQVTVAQYYTETLVGNSTTLSTLQSVIANVTNTTDVSSSAAIEAAIGSAGGVGQTFPLTTSVDTLVGTTGNDTFTGLVDYTAGGVATGATTTFTAADTVTGGAGTDTLTLTVTGAATGPNAGVTLAAAAVSGVETINVRSVTGSGQVVTVAASNFVGATAVNSDRSVDAVTITGLAAGAAAGQIGNTTVTNGALTFGYAAAGPAIVNLSGGTKGAGAIVNTSDATSVTINSTGASNTVGAVTLSNTAVTTSATINASTNLTVTSLSNSFTGATTDKLTVSGAATLVTLGTAPATLDIVDASGMTAGGVSLTIGNLASVITGGQGNDTITTAGVQTGLVAAGAGTADRLVVAALADIAATPGAKFTGFEILRNADTAAATLDVSTVVGITSVELGATGAGATKMTASQALAVTNLTNNATQTLALATATGTADVLTVTLKNSTATTSADLTGATITGFETLNVVSSSGTGAAMADVSALAFAAAGDLTTLNLSGAFPISVSTTNITKAATISAAGMTYVGAVGTDYALSLSGNLVKGSSVTGTGAADSITTTAQIVGTSGDFVTYAAGAGNDAISSTVAAIYNTAGSFGSVKIDGGDGTDTLTLTDAAGLTLVDANAQYLTNIEKITYAVANQAISITSGGFFDTNFKTNGVTLTLGDATNAQANTVDLTTFTGKATVALTASGATPGAQAVTTGSGADSVTLLAAGTTTATHTVSTGGGDDTIAVTISGTTITTGTVTINGGAGQDSITVTGDSLVNADTAVNTVVRVVEGHSTLAAADSVTGVVLSDATKQAFQLDFDGTASKNADVASTSVTGYTAAELTYTVSNGLLTFAGTSAAALTAAQKATLAQTLITTADKAVAFTSGSDSYVFHNGAATDSLVKLVGVAVLGIDTTVVGYIDVA